MVKYLDDIKQKQIKRIIYLINTFENPYPRDIFNWENQEKITLSRGRFNQFINSIVENTKISIIRRINDDFDD